MMMKRKFEDVLVSWKNKHSRKPALIYGARQIGKTTSIKYFGEKHFQNTFYIKFELEIIPDIKNVKNLSESQQKEKEGELILSKITPTDQLILFLVHDKKHISLKINKIKNLKLG